MDRQQMITAATNWWREQLSGVPKLDNGDQSPTGGITWALAMLAAKPTPADTVERYIAAMTAWLTERPESHRRTVLDVDYGPGYELDQIAKRGDMSLLGLNFPWKTVMWLDWEAGTVTVKHGYRAELQSLTAE